MTERGHYDAVVIGGGFFGCSLAIALARQRRAVLLVERSHDLLTRASYHNQARVHQGYHYPRSVLTALRSRINFPRFVETYRECIVDDFEKYYAIGRKFSKVTALQFQRMMERVGAPLWPAPRRVTKLFNAAFIETVFAVRECAFDAVKLREHVGRQLEESGAELVTGTRAVRLARTDTRLRVTLAAEDATQEVTTSRVYNCTYSQLNELLSRSNFPCVRLKHELTEMPLVDVPAPLKNLGITVMCGPYFSVMPFPPRGLHTLSHVRFTPHGSWHDGNEPWRDGYACLAGHRPPTNFRYMIADAARYLPLMRECRHVDSLWEIKTVLPQSEDDDSRPILFRHDCGLPGHTCVLGAKIDNIFDVLTELASEA
jgi:glycine/D-amino acid oxidase-like deaminating enzyme